MSKCLVAECNFKTTLRQIYYVPIPILNTSITNVMLCQMCNCIDCSSIGSTTNSSQCVGACVGVCVGVWVGMRGCRVSCCEYEHV